MSIVSATTRASQFVFGGLAAIVASSLALSAASARTTVPPAGDAASFFEAKVRPVLAERCYSCHGPKIQQGGLRLDSAAGLRKPTDSGRLAVVPGDPERSPLILAVRQTGALKMPPGGKLASGEIAALERWVKSGAAWLEVPGVPAQPSATAGLPGDDPRWAFKPIRATRTPTVKDRAWASSPIDAYILAGLEAKGLRPAPAADRRTLIRRASFDLTGLPPTPEEVEAFVNDRSPSAWAKVVDRMLASPAFGQRWGRHWLDIVRYCDSFDARILGDNNPGNTMDATEAWRYRDWVVRAFNADMPYDQFIANQIAGDLLPASEAGALNRDGIVATGMLAIGNWGGGDADKEKLLTDIADDQVDVVSRAFLGLTVACARCHDHKFDPITTKDYYGLAGIFFSTHILENVGPKTNGPPMLRIPLTSPKELEERKQRMERVKALEGRLQGERQSAYAELARSLKPETAKYITAAADSARTGKPVAEVAAERRLLPFAVRQWRDALGLGGFPSLPTAQREVGGKPGVLGWRGAADCPNATVNTTAAEQAILTFRLPPHSVTVHPGPSAGVAAIWTSPIEGKVSIAGRATDADPVCGNGVEWQIARRRGAADTLLAFGDLPNGGTQAFSAGSGAERLTGVDVRKGDELQLRILPKGDYTCDSTTIELRLTGDQPRLAGDNWDIARDLVPDPLQGNPHSDRFGNAGVWRFADMATGGGPSDPALVPVAKAAATGDLPQLAAASDTFVQRFDPASANSPFLIRSTTDETALPQAVRDALANLSAELGALRKQPLPDIEFANGAQDGGVPGSPQAGVHDVKVHIRGRYDRLGDLVPRRFPAILAGSDQPAPMAGSGRLELARWLSGPSNPLPARVMANRIWQHLFGEGIVRTPSNFGKLGERPTHPALLDYLASSFASGTQPGASGANAGGAWSVKSLIRQIMLSNAYKQSSIGAPATAKADPGNRLFGRMNRKRLEAEALRDSLLAVAGRLDASLGGKAVRDFMSPRRTLYQMAIRSDRTGFGPLFDVADTTASIDKRTESTIAPQALFLWNHPFTLAQAKALSERLEKDSPGRASARVDRAYRLLYARPASAEEQRIALAFLGQPDAKRWEEYCLLLLCANEFLYAD